MVYSGTTLAVAEPQRIASPGSLSIDYESKEAKDDSEFQVLWSRIMDKGPYQNPSTYKKVEVLMLYWAKNSDDLEPESEVSRLKSVFQDRFHYTTHTECLNHDSEQALQLSVNVKIASFVYQYDGPQTLLIVYYAGHGRQGSEYGQMEIFGQTSENDKRDDQKRKWNKIVWNQTEDLLRPARADVLEIFDCCYAGTLGLTKGEDRRSFEYLAATKFDRGTPVPGIDSFTAALIFALNELLDETPEGRFTTVELLRKIKCHPPFPKDQFPELSDRRVKDRSTPVGRIMLHPLPGRGNDIASLEKADDFPSVKRQTITLHFDFGKEISLADIETLGEEINTFSEHNASLVINAVRWGGLKQSMVHRFVQSLKDSVRRSSMKRKRVELSISTPEASQDTTGPPTPCSMSQESPGQLEPVSGGSPANDASLLCPTSPSRWPRDTTPHSQDSAKKQRVERE